MDIQKTLDELYGLSVFGIKLGLENINEILNRLGNPQDRYKTIHIAGTNGKGSTASMIECILLEKGYKPENITLEKTWAAGHGTSGRLDICVTREDGSEYLLIECKTHGKEFEKEFTRMKKDGGQLFTYSPYAKKHISNSIMQL